MGQDEKEAFNRRVLSVDCCGCEAKAGEPCIKSGRKATQFHNCRVKKAERYTR